MISLFIDGLKSEIEELQRQYPALKEEDIFLVWFLRAYVTEDVDLAANAVTNGPKDKGIDAVFMDDSSRCVFVVQRKYRPKPTVKSESRQDVTGFAQLASIPVDSDMKAFKSLVEGADPTVAEKLDDARKRLARRGYRLWLY